MLNIDLSSLRKSLGTLQQMSRSKFTKSNKQIDFHSFKAKNHSYGIAAVDGSNISIGGVSFAIAALRAGSLIYRDGKIEKSQKNISPIKVEVLVNSDSKKNGYLKVYKEFYKEVIGELPGDFIDFDKAAERLRTLMEWKTISELVHTLPKGDIIIFDGSLISGSISTNKDYFDNLVTLAKDRGISLVGLSKDTSLMEDDVPVPSLLREASKVQCPNSNWYVEWEVKKAEEDVVVEEENDDEVNEETSKVDKVVEIDIGQTYFVKFTRMKELIFRMDAVYPDDTNIEEVLSKIGAYCFDTATLGYPYPMQQIHDEVRISRMDKDQIFAALKTDWVKQKGNMKDFEELFFNYHDQLDIISSGR